ncbi:MAG: glycine cleavage system protein GcvH [bacterium]|nr:glycine cleavage system protein GcvH [bacterium]
MIPEELKYTDTHEWLKIEGEYGIVGITQYGFEKLGDVVYVELPEVGSKVKQGETFGVIESVKAAVDLIAPVSGIVEEVNESAKKSPENLPNDPYGDSWLIKIKIENPLEIEKLLTSKAYEELTKE